MTEISDHILTALVDALYALEISNEDDVQPDLAIEIMENASATLRLLTPGDLALVRQMLIRLAAQETDAEKRHFIEQFPNNFALD